MSFAIGLGTWDTPDYTPPLPPSTIRLCMAASLSLSPHSSRDDGLGGRCTKTARRAIIRPTEGGGGEKLQGFKETISDTEIENVVTAAAVHLSLLNMLRFHVRVGRSSIFTSRARDARNKELLLRSSRRNREQQQQHRPPPSETQETPPSLPSHCYADNKVFTASSFSPKHPSFSAQEKENTSTLRMQNFPSDFANSKWEQKNLHIERRILQLPR